MVLGREMAWRKVPAMHDKDFSFNSQNPWKCWTQRKYMHSHGSYGEMAFRDSRISRNARAKETDLQWKNNKERLSQRRWRGKTAIRGCPLTVAHTQRYAWPLFSLPASHTEIRKTSLPSILENPKGRKLQSGFQRRLWEKGPGTVSHRFPPKSRASASALHPHVVQRQSSLLSLPST